MNTLHDRLAELADDAPTGGVPAAELWARGKRAHRFRVAGIAAALLVVGAVGAGIGEHLADEGNKRADVEPVGTTGISLPIEYPVGEALPDLGSAPGPLAAIWLAPRGAGAAPEAVGLVAETGVFGTLPIDVFKDDPEGTDCLCVALSTDGRRMAYYSPKSELVVHDLVSGDSVSPLSESKFEARAGSTWVDATHLFGLVAGGSDGDGWVWEPGAAPKRVDTYAYAEGFDLWVSYDGSGPQPWPGDVSCSSPILLDGTGEYGEWSPGWGYTLEVPELCDVLGVFGSEMLLGHWNSDRVPGSGWKDPNDGNRTVVALDVHGIHGPFEDPALRPVVATAPAPERVAFATDLIGEALDATGGAS